MTKWINVDDRLPKTEITCVCLSIPKADIKKFNDSRYIPACDDIFGACFINGKWTDNPYGDYEADLYVTHWIPFPMPPKD